MTCVRFSPGGGSGLARPGGHLLASCSHDKTLKLWRVGHAANGGVGQRAHGTAESGDVALSADLTASLTPIAWKLVHPKELTGVAFSPDGVRVVTCSMDQRLRVWSCVALVPKPSECGWDGRLLTESDSLADGTRATGVPRETRTGVPHHHEVPFARDFRTAEIERVMLTPDGRFVLSAGHDKVRDARAATDAYWP